MIFAWAAMTYAIVATYKLIALYRIYMLLTCHIQTCKATSCLTPEELQFINATSLIRILQSLSKYTFHNNVFQALFQAHKESVQCSHHPNNHAALWALDF